MHEVVHTVRAVGGNGLLLELREPADVHRLAQWIRAQPAARDLLETIPGATTVFLLGDRTALARIGDSVIDAELPPRQEDQRRTVVVPVRYDGPDLGNVAEQTGLRVRDVVALHSQAEYAAAFFGFAPGQAFFTGVPQPLRIPRLQSPRKRVPSGSLAIANEFSVIYPQDSPGGWNLIGTRVGPPLWDERRRPPNAVDVGDRVVFDEVR
jgi:KipI family sensor histidine kinase inhibitor